MYPFEPERRPRSFDCLNRSERMNRLFLRQGMGEIEMLIKNCAGDGQIRFQALEKLGYMKSKLDEFDRGDGGIEREISCEIMELKDKIKKTQKKLFHSFVSFGNNYSHH